MLAPHRHGRLDAGRTTGGRCRDRHAVDAVRHRVSCAEHHHGAERDVEQMATAPQMVQERQQRVQQQFFQLAALLQLVLRVRPGGQVQSAPARRLPDVSVRQRVRQQVRLLAPLVLLSTNCAAGHQTAFPWRIGLRWRAEQQPLEFASARQARPSQLVQQRAHRPVRACGFSFSRRRRILTGRG